MRERGVYHYLAICNSYVNFLLSNVMTNKLCINKARAIFKVPKIQRRDENCNLLFVRRTI